MTATAAPTAVDAPELDGAILFGRYAFPPNERGYCGPDRADELLERVSVGASGRALEEVARGFDGAWPYLEVIGESLGRAPLDPLVVRTYWLGGPLLVRCGGRRFASSLESRFRPRLTRLDFERLADAVAHGATPHHSFHVFGVYPWVGLLRGGTVDAPLEVLDRCRISWGRVMNVSGETAHVETRRLTWDGRRLVLGSARVEPMRLRRGELVLSRAIEAGDWVSLHWDWVCDRLTRTDLADLQRSTARELAAVESCAYAAPATVLA
ncbi:DUF6390 family protein [Demequina zhanjiangensis]|uniref:DUF6390 family protein n=1 Tax=Demequina zhanjiangensis TaxID=3051659 RepID=A0ABT8G2W0_9MICO|nr:DUF6390 family protein [Demequina sp. SYSU T00b26]MDN4473486.1 DUF6390 family protein [Demequina sp. SYSU T00b26]